MTALMMGAIVPDAVPVDEATVRATAVPVYHDAPPSTMDAPPDWNEFDTDGDPRLGMVNRALSSYTVPSVKYAPDWAGRVDDAHLYNDRINATISHVGLAPSREAQGQFGHGTAQVSIAIDPVQDLSGAGGLTNDYFVRDARPIQEPAQFSVQPPPGFDYTTPGEVGAAGKTAAQGANSASAYALFYAQMAGN